MAFLFFETGYPKDRAFRDLFQLFLNFYKLNLIPCAKGRLVA